MYILRPASRIARRTALAWHAVRVAPWKLPLVVLAITAPIAVAFYAGGPGLGVAAGALVGVAIVVVAVRQRPRVALGSAAVERPGRLLLVAACAVEDPAAIAEIAAAAPAPGLAGSVMVLAPARIGFLDRWASDVEGARRAAQRSLVITVASLAKAGVEAEARVGDEDLVQAVEDQLQSFEATEVILVSAGAEEDPGAAAAVAELEARLLPRFRWLRISDPAAR
jgi:hypothetical protein